MAAKIKISSAHPHTRCVDENSQEPQDRMITYIDKSPREPPVPHNLDNKESLGSNFSTLGGSERDRGRYRGSTIFVIN
uniref:Uncharacterized protein n=1 Tax=Oryza nivara TaxID=4536 RepID=A0A0E0J462_ORYNI